MAGMLSGLIGIGGGVVMVPLFILLIGLNQYDAQGLSLAVMLPPVTFLSVYNYHKSGGELINWKIVLLLSTMMLIGGFIGSKIALHTNQYILKKIFGVIMLIIAIKFIFFK
jgi:uncharacterized membrane protein YfcA